MNFQDVIRDVHDPVNHRLHTDASITGGQATVTPLQAWPDPKTYIGLVTVTGSLGLTGNVTLDPGSRTGILGNLTLSDSKGFIGLTTVVQASSARTITGNLTLSDSKGFIGLTTVVQASSARTITGNLTLSDPKGYIGLVTNTPSWGSEATVYATVVSATGNTTLFVAPASNRFFIKDLHVSSLGRAEIQFLSGATVFIPFTSLATNSGFAAFYGEMGKPARAATDALVANLNGGATVSIGVTYRIAP